MASCIVGALGLLLAAVVSLSFCGLVLALTAPALRRVARRMGRQAWCTSPFRAQRVRPPDPQRL